MNPCGTSSNMSKSLDIKLSIVTAGDLLDKYK